MQIQFITLSNEGECARSLLGAIAANDRLEYRMPNPHASDKLPNVQCRSEFF
jgi:hypothetical protein